MDETEAYYTEASQPEKHQYNLLSVYMEFRKMVIITLYAMQQKRQMYRTVLWALWEKTRVRCFERIALKNVYYHM